MLLAVTRFYPEKLLPLPTQIGGKDYFSALEVIRDVGVSRQTLWRWRQEAKIPAGLRFRNGQVLFTAEDLEAIRAYANRIEPATLANGRQMKLFVRGES